MCGIFAAINLKHTWSSDVLKVATDTLSSRGPDASGIWENEGVFLGHRRLSIIDLASGSQPMLSHDERYVVTFNGEIYNFETLRSQLQQSGHHFKTQSDTEVILEAYRCWGDQCVSHLNGIFSFVLWDREHRRILAARDRLGVKPLCWMFFKGGTLFCSTLTPLLHLPGLPRNLDYESLRDIMVYDYIPAPRTILKNVYKLKPGHFMTWQPSKEPEPQIQTYWQVPNVDTSLTRYSETELVSKVESLISQSVKRQMVSDVPLGAFLSGGIDSSLLVYYMSQHSAKPVKTFSISFTGSTYDESKFAKQVSQWCGTDHTTLPAEETQSEDVYKIIGQLDEPFCDPALIPTVVLSALTRSHVTVALSGDGGDEIFGGYPKYLFQERQMNRPYQTLMRPLKWLFDFIPARPRGMGRFYWRALPPHEQFRYWWTHYSDYPVFRKDIRLLMKHNVQALMHIEDFFKPWQTQADQWGPDYTCDSLMRTDLTTYLSENCLVKTDRASMMHSLEVRVPLLDEMIVDFVVPMPASLKVPNGQLKSLLLPLCQKLLPRSVWDRPKHGFTVPLGRYMADEWCSLVKQLLDWGETNLPIFNYPYLQKLVSINSKDHSVYRELWNPIVFLIWWSQHAEQISL